MPITNRLYEKEQSVINVFRSPSVTPSETPSNSVSATPSITPSETPSVSVTPTVSLTISVTPSPTPSVAYFASASVYNCISVNGDIQCGQLVGNVVVYNGSGSFQFGKFYVSGSTVYQVQSSSQGYSTNYVTITGSAYNTCIEACNVAIPSPTPTPSKTPSVTPSKTPSVTPSPSGS